MLLTHRQRCGSNSSSRGAGAQGAAAVAEAVHALWLRHRCPARNVLTGEGLRRLVAALVLRCRDGDGDAVGRAVLREKLALALGLSDAPGATASREQFTAVLSAVLTAAARAPPSAARQSNHNDDEKAGESGGRGGAGVLPMPSPPSPVDSCTGAAASEEASLSSLSAATLAEGGEGAASTSTTPPQPTQPLAVEEDRSDSDSGAKDIDAQQLQPLPVSLFAHHAAEAAAAGAPPDRSSGAAAAPTRTSSSSAATAAGKGGRSPPSARVLAPTASFHRKRAVKRIYDAAAECTFAPVINRRQPQQQQQQRRPIQYARGRRAEPQQPAVAARRALLDVDVDGLPGGESGRITVREGDTPHALAATFCAAYGLEDKLRHRLEWQLTARMADFVDATATTQ